MKGLFSVKFNLALAHIWLFIFRVTVSGFLLTHGYPKFERLISGEEIKFADPIGLGPVASFILITFAEFLCSILIILGLATRLATIPIIIAMAVLAFMHHADDPWGVREKPLLFLLCFITILILGAGKYSVDKYIGKK